MLRGTGVTSSVIQAEGARGAGEHEAADARGDGLLEQRQRAGDVGVHEILAAVRAHVRLVQRRRVQHRPHPGEAGPDRGAVGDGTDGRGEGGGEQVKAHDVTPGSAQRAHQRLPQVPGAAGHKDAVTRHAPHDTVPPRGGGTWWDGRVRPHLTIPGKLTAGDKVAVVSPSFAAPGPFPEVHELAMTRLREEIGLEPVEYPTTRQLGAPQRARADDLMAAFADPDIKAVLATIGGDDQITVLPFLDPEVVMANPNAFLGYSDNANLLTWLWYHGVAGYHGGSTMVHLGRPGGLHPVSTASLRAALFTGGDVQL